MEHTDRKTVTSGTVEFPGQVFPLFALSITLAINSRHFFAIDDEGHPFNRFRREDMDIGRKGNLRLPRFQRVVIAQDGKDLYIILCQFMQEAHVIELCRQVVIGTGVDITRDEDSVDSFINGHLDDLLEGPDRRFPDDTLPPFINGGKVMEGTP